MSVVSISTQTKSRLPHEPNRYTFFHNSASAALNNVELIAALLDCNRQLAPVGLLARETGLTLETRHALRNEESRPILERIKVSIEAARSGRYPECKDQSV